MYVIYFNLCNDFRGVRKKNYRYLSDTSFCFTDLHRCDENRTRLLKLLARAVQLGCENYEPMFSKTTARAVGAFLGYVISTTCLFLSPYISSQDSRYFKRNLILRGQFDFFYIQSTKSFPCCSLRTFDTRFY